MSTKTVTQEQKDLKPARFKVTYDLSETVAGCIEAISAELGCSQSDVAAHLLVVGIAQYQSGKLNLRAIRRPHAFQLRFAYKLPPPMLRVARTAPSGEGSA